MAAGGDRSAWRTLADLSAIGMTLVVATVVGLAGGYYLDRWLGTSPFLTIGGLLIGIAAGFVNLFRSVKAAERDMEKHD